MKEGDLVIISAEATGLGEPMEAVIDKIEIFMKPLSRLLIPIPTLYPAPVVALWMYI